MKINPNNLKNLSAEENKQYDRAMALKGKIETVTEKFIEIDSDPLLDFTHEIPGMVKTEFSEIEENVNIITRGELVYDTATKVPIRMRAEEDLYGLGAGRYRRDTTDFTYEDTKVEKVYGMKRFGVKQELRVEKASGVLYYHESTLHLLDQDFSFFCK